MPTHHMRQVNGVGFSLSGKVRKKERNRIEAAVEDYIRDNYEVIRSYFTDNPKDNGSTVRLCINRTTGEVSIVSANGSDIVNGGQLLRKRRQRRETDSSQQGEKEANSTDRNAATTSEQQPSDTGSCGASMDAAIEYLLNRDRSGGVYGPRSGSQVRLLRSSIPSLSTAHNSSEPSSRSLTLPSALTKRQLQSRHRQQTDTSVCFSAEERKAGGNQLVSNSYDCDAHGAAFKMTFPSVKGEFFVLYDHGETHCRKILTALGFTERREDEEHDGFRSVDQMAIMWCNGAIAASKRKRGLGYHIVNRLRYRGLITNKCSLVRTLTEFEVSHPYLVPKGLEASSFLPATIHINGSEAIDIFNKIRYRGLYLIKPGYSDCGKGIVLYRSDGTIGSLIHTLNVSYPDYAQRDLVLQTYIENPLLLGGKKFDLRVFLLVVPNQRKEVGVYAFVHPGYARLACRNFKLDSDDLTLHLTNQAVQHRDKTYKLVKEDTVWSPDTLNQYLNEHRTELAVPCQDWVKRRLYPRVRAILAHMVSVISSSLCDEPMSYELFGCDFLVDAKFNVWLLEVNSDPSLNKSTNVLRQIVTQVVEEGVGLAVEVLQRTVRGMPIKELATRRDYKKIFSHANESVVRCIMAENRIRYRQHLVS